MPAMSRYVLACLLGSAPALASPTISKAAQVIDGVSDKPRDGVAVLVDGDAIVGCFAARSAAAPTATADDRACSTGRRGRACQAPPRDAAGAGSRCIRGRRGKESKQIGRASCRERV